MVLAWIVGAAALWVVAGAAVAFLVAAVIGRSGAASGAEEPRILVPSQRTAPPIGLRSQPHLPCTGVGRSPSHH